jgi:hypothetical protein
MNVPDEVIDDAATVASELGTNTVIVPARLATPQGPEVPARDS